MPTGYESIYLGLLPRLAECDFEECAARLAMPRPLDGAITLRFLGRDYRISREGIAPLDNKPGNVNNLSVIAYYALSQGAGDVGSEFAPMFTATGSHQVKVDNLMADPLVREFGADVGSFERAATRVGGIRESSADGKYVWLFRALPKVPIRIVLYEEDEEFPAEAQILFERTAKRFMEFECLAFLAGCLASALVETSRVSEHP